MRVTCCQKPSAETLELRMRRYNVNKPNAKTEPTVLIDNEDIRQPGKRRVVSNDTGESDLLFVFEQAKV